VIRRWVIEARHGTVRYWVCVVVLVSRLAATRLARLRMLFTGLLMPVCDRFGWDSARSTRFDIQVGRRRLEWWVGPHTDLYLMNDILIQGVYGELDIGEPRTILDLGSHIGLSVLAFREAYPSARIVGLEPDPRNLARLRRNVAQLGGVEVRPQAVAAADGTVPFVLDDQPWASGVGPSTTRVPATTLGRLVDELHPDLLKVNIEGTELTLLDELGKIDAIVGELHDREGDRERLLRSLEGFEVKLVGEMGHTDFRARRL
jgi:FkbM family methyltransferase